MNDLTSQLDAAVASGKLLESSRDNILRMLAASSSPLCRQSINELVMQQAWGELNDRFFRTLAFGTGGLRGRTIGRVVTNAERGTPTPLGRPEFPCTGTNAMNTFNISRAMQGLVAYAREWFAKNSIAGKPKIVIGHDTRHFSREFADLCSKVGTDLGCDIYLTESARSTPEVSFAIRHTNSTAGIVLTASHNPPHDNGFKCYFSDGGQTIDPHATGIIGRVNAIASDVYEPLPPERRGKQFTLGTELDEAYMKRLQTLVLDPAMVRQQSGLNVVYSNLHGTGGVIIRPMLERLGFPFSTVPEQDSADGRFPTVKSPNPENSEALALAMDAAKKNGADIVLATDPDCDRMGAAYRDSKGEMQLVTGNQIGSLLAWYRTMKLFEQGVLTKENAKNAALIKTFVTTDLQKTIADRHGIRCVETLTGFKYIGAKLLKYEQALPAEVQAKYRALPESETRALRLRHSTFFIFGGEESYGYSGGDFVRDKDGNGAVVMFAEVAAYAKSRGMTVGDLLDEIYREYGFYLERGCNLTYEGAEGAAKIQRLVQSYAANPPTEIAGTAVSAVKDFSKDETFDCDGDRIPAEAMMMFELAGGGRIAVRPSGTEPKIKYYLFAQRQPEPGARFTADQLAMIKNEIKAALESIWQWLQADAETRLS
jgi:phosphoglucomutase